MQSLSFVSSSCPLLFRRSGTDPPAGAAQRALRLISQAGLFQIRVQVRLERVVTRHLVPLAARFAGGAPTDAAAAHRRPRPASRAPRPPARTKTISAISAIPQTDRRAHINAVERLPRIDGIEHCGFALLRGVARSPVPTRPRYAARSGRSPASQTGGGSRPGAD